jgi:predicted metal-binding membrane protein
VMMAAMMLPSLVPTVAIFQRLSRSLTFAAGYLLVWTVAGLAAYGLFEMGKVLLAHELAWRSGGRWVSVGVLALAGAYQLTPLKDACLRRCRTLPDTAGAAAIAGLRAGAWCTGCTWALMAALFALGVMSLTWMALIALLVAVEKVGPSPRAGKAATAIVLLAAAVGIAAAPGHVPALVIPGAMH